MPDRHAPSKPARQAASRSERRYVSCRQHFDGLADNAAWGPAPDHDAVRQADQTLITTISQDGG